MYFNVYLKRLTYVKKLERKLFISGNKFRQERNIQLHSLGIANGTY